MSRSSAYQPTLFACWKKPEPLPDKDVVILSFLSLEAEEDLKSEFQGKLISAREIAPSVKDKAIKTYINLVAEIPATPIKARNGQTLRQALKNKDGVSTWWFHKVSEKDCESDDTFNSIIEVFIISHTANSVGCKEIRILGGKKEISNAFKSAYKVIEVEPRGSGSLVLTLVKGLLSRADYLAKFLRLWSAVRTTPRKQTQQTLDIVLAGFWDWSVKLDQNTGRLIDHYFKSLPQELAKVSRVGWLLWFDPYFQPTHQRLKPKTLLEQLKNTDNVTILQDFLSLKDLIRAIFNIKPFFTFQSFFRAQEFRDTFAKDGIDFSLLLKPKLYSGFSNFIIPHHELVYLASLRAFNKYKPRLTVSFLEFLLYSRSLYQAAQDSYATVINCAVQHASYSREKTFAILEPTLEYEGEPDSCPMPKPDYIFAMGELGKEIFAESGFPAERVLLTGSPRYEHVNTSTRRKDKPKKPIKLLIIASLDRDHEMEMVEAAYLASKDLPSVRLSLRNHPFARMDECPAFQKYEDRINITDQTLEDDLREADLIIFTYSTVAEEALLRGIPVWQWCSITYNASVFRDIGGVPQFYFASDLRDALQAFINNPDAYRPSSEIREMVLRKCFYKDDGKPSQRVAEKITSILDSA